MSWLFSVIPNLHACADHHGRADLTRSRARRDDVSKEDAHGRRRAVVPHEAAYSEFGYVRLARFGGSQSFARRQIYPTCQK